MAVPSERPIRLVVAEDDLRRNRLTAFFRLLLFLPHLVWLALWWIVASLASVLAWLVALVLGRVPPPLHRFLAAFVRYSAHVKAYVLLAGAPFPGFLGREGYPVHIDIAPPERQRRLGILFRLPLVLPAIVLMLVLVPLPSGPFVYVGFHPGVVGFWAAFLAWWVCVVLGRIPRGLRDLLVYGLGYGGQVSGYFFLLTSRYPDSRPSLAPISVPPHPVRIQVSDELRRSRLTVLFRLLLALPHLVWLALWSVAAAVAILVSWVIALVIGRVPNPLHRFLAAFVRYATHVSAYVMLVGGRFPGFTGAEASYGIDLEIDPPMSQRRLVTLFRVPLALPAGMLAYAFSIAQFVIAVFIWFYALVLGRAPEGLRDLGAALIRYHAQLNAYLFLLTSRYPHSAPALVPDPVEPASATFEPIPPPPPPPFEPPAPLPQAP